MQSCPPRASQLQLIYRSTLQYFQLTTSHSRCDTWGPPLKFYIDSQCQSCKWDFFPFNFYQLENLLSIENWICLASSLISDERKQVVSELVEGPFLQILIKIRFHKSPTTFFYFFKSFLKFVSVFLFFSKSVFLSSCPWTGNRCGLIHWDGDKKRLP